MASDAWPGDIPIWINGAQKWMTGLTRRTTCDDVIYALLYVRGVLDHDSTDNYAVFERWRAVERPLQGCSKIVKVWSAWGEEQHNVQLLVQRLDDYFIPSAHFTAIARRAHRLSHRQRGKHSGKCRCMVRAQCRCSRLKVVDHLTRYLIKQERHRQKLERRIHDMDRQIAEHETRQHARRMQQNGQDYVQDSYLVHHGSDSGSSSSQNSLDCLLLAVGEDAVDDYLNLCDSLYNVMTRLEQMQHMQQSLARELEAVFLEGQRTSVPSVVKQSSGEDWDVQLEAVQIQLTRAVAASVLQHQEELALIKELQTWDAMVREKQESVRRLQQELDLCEEDSHLNDPPSASPRLVHSNGVVRREEMEAQHSADQTYSYDRCFTDLHGEGSVNPQSVCMSTACKQNYATTEYPADSPMFESNSAIWAPVPETMHLICKSTSIENSRRIKSPTPSTPRQKSYSRLPSSTVHAVSPNTSSLQGFGQDDVKQLPAILLSDRSKCDPSNGPSSIRNGCPPRLVSQGHAVTEYSEHSKHNHFRENGMDNQDHVSSEHSKFRSNRVSNPHVSDRYFQLFSFCKDDSGVSSSDSSTDNALPFDSAKLSENVKNSGKLNPSSSDSGQILDVRLGYNTGQVQADKDTQKNRPNHSTSAFASSNPHGLCSELSSHFLVSMRRNVNYDAREIQTVKDRHRDAALPSSNSSTVVTADPHSTCVNVDLETPGPVKVQSGRVVGRGCEASWILDKSVGTQGHHRRNSSRSESNQDLKSDTVRVIVNCRHPRLDQRCTTPPCLDPASIQTYGRHDLYAHNSSTAPRVKTVRFADEMASRRWCDDAGSSDDTGLSSLHDDDALETLV